MSSGPGVDDCWNRIGVRGDHSCPRLVEHVHCRNCEVYAGAAQNIMRRALPESYRREWTAHFARPPAAPAAVDSSALVFRVGTEWLALPAALALFVTEPVQPRRLPHRADPALLGIANLRGELYPCVSLAHLLQIEASAPAASASQRVHVRMLALRLAQLAVALPVAEVLGVQRYARAELQPPPAAVAQAAPPYVAGILQRDDKRIGCLDADLLGQQVARRLK